MVTGSGQRAAKKRSLNWQLRTKNLEEDPISSRLSLQVFSSDYFQVAGCLSNRQARCAGRASMSGP
jgi:hypothetical protein